MSRLCKCIRSDKIPFVAFRIGLVLMLCSMLTPASPVASQSVLDAANVEAAALAKVASLPALLPAGYKPFQVGTIRISERWALLNLVAFPVHSDPDADLIVPHVLLAVAHLDEVDNVRVAIETEEEYRDLVPRVPDDLLSQESKSMLLSVPSRVTHALTAYQIPGLPWQKGVSWRYTQGPHGSGQDALDFATPDRTSGWVHAADRGTVMYSTETCMGVKRPSDGLRLWYQHIRPSDIDNFPVGTSISLDQTLGMTTLQSGCGGYSTGHHVHFYFDYYSQQVPSEGSSMNSWVSRGQNLVKNGVTVTPSGDWILYSDSSDITAPPSNDCLKPLLRYWHDGKTKHFYTRQWEELGPGKSGWTYEGFEGYVAANPDCFVPDTYPLYRFWHPDREKHFYTTSASEKAKAEEQGFVYEGVTGYVFRKPNSLYRTLPLYRCYSSQADNHFYTTEWNEVQSATDNYGYVYESIEAYLFDAEALNLKPTDIYLPLMLHH